MLQLKYVAENPDSVIERLALKGFDAKDIVGKIVELDKEKRKLQHEIENLKQSRIK